jgi:prepilin peptidase CpaA
MEPGRTAICACLAIVALAAISDLLSRKIPNTLTIGGILLGVAIHGARGYVEAGGQGILRGLGSALLGVAVCGVFPLMSFARRQMGGGDVKLFGAIGALCGPVVGFDAEAFAFVIVIALVFPFRLLRHGALHASLRNGWTAIRNAIRPDPERLVYAVVKLVVMAPSILLGLCVALVRHGGLF